MKTGSHSIDEKGKSLWVSWERHRRSQNLAAKFGVPLYEFHSRTPRWIKHPVFILYTLVLLIRKRPHYLFVQNPSAILTLLTIFLQPLFRYKLIVDAHNAGVYPFESGHEKYAALFPYMHRYVDLTIVTNNFLADIVDGNGGRSVILPDPLPELQDVPKISKDPGKFVVTLICSYANDEPYIEVFKAAALLPDTVRIYVTGNDCKLTREERELALRNNVVLTGFLSEKEYLRQLSGSDCILVLTSFNDCMVCGAYEAVSLGLPLILTDTPVLRWWFEGGAIFSKNTDACIVEAILCIGEHHASMVSKIHELRAILQGRWNIKFEIFKKLFSK